MHVLNELNIPKTWLLLNPALLFFFFFCCLVAVPPMWPFAIFVLVLREWQGRQQIRPWQEHQTQETAESTETGPTFKEGRSMMGGRGDKQGFQPFWWQIGNRNSAFDKSVSPNCDFFGYLFILLHTS